MEKGYVGPSTEHGSAGPTSVPVFFNVPSEELAGAWPLLLRSPHLPLHLWHHTSMRDVSDLLCASEDEQAGGVRQAAALVISLIYPDRRGAPTLKRLGRVARRQRGAEDQMTLAVAGFQAGDGLLVETNSNESKAPPDGGFARTLTQA